VLAEGGRQRRSFESTFAKATADLRFLVLSFGLFGRWREFKNCGAAMAESGGFLN